MQARDPVDCRSADSAYMLAYWDLTDTLIDGAEAMRLAGTKYLPRFAGEADTEYDFRVRMSKFTNVYRDIVEALASKPFEEPISFPDRPGKKNVIPTEIEDFIKDVDGGGSDLNMFAGATFFNGINSAIDWIFVDYPAVDRSQIVTLADAQAAGIRPFWSHILARNMLEVRSSVVSGEEQLLYVRIYEPGAPDHVRIIRKVGDLIVWFLLQKTNDGEHTPKAEWLWTPAGRDEKTRYIEVGRGTFSIPVIPVVAFWTGRRNGRSWRFWPAMRDAADLQVELYQEESGLKFAATMTAFPMLAGNGVRPELGPDKQPKRLAVGPNRVIYGPPDANGTVPNWAYVEPAATSLNFLAQRVKDTIANLRELGRQPLTAQSGNLTVITTAVAAGKSKSAVGAWAKMLEVSINSALAITCMYYGISEETYKPDTHVYDDFDDFDASGKDLDALDKARARRDVSQKTYWKELQRRRVLSDDFDPEAETQELLNEVPADNGETV